MMNSCSLRTTLVFGALAAAACGGGGDVPDETPSGDQPAAETDAPVAQESDAGATDSVGLETLTGQVLITGTAQLDFVTLQIDGGGAGEPGWGTVLGVAAALGRPGQRRGVTDGGQPS